MKGYCYVTFVRFSQLKRLNSIRYVEKPSTELVVGRANKVCSNRNIRNCVKTLKIDEIFYMSGEEGIGEQG